MFSIWSALDPIDGLGLILRDGPIIKGRDRDRLRSGSTSSGLNLTNAQVEELKSQLNATIVDLSTAKTSSSPMQTSLNNRASDASPVQNDQTPLIVGCVGLVLGIVAIALVLINRKRGKT